MKHHRRRRLFLLLFSLSFSLAVTQGGGEEKSCLTKRSRRFEHPKTAEALFPSLLCFRKSAPDSQFSLCTKKGVGRKTAAATTTTKPISDLPTSTGGGAERSLVSSPPSLPFLPHRKLEQPESLTVSKVASLSRNLPLARSKRERRQNSNLRQGVFARSFVGKYSTNGSYELGNLIPYAAQYPSLIRNCY